MKANLPSLSDYLSTQLLRNAVQGALDEDIREGDVTTLPTIPADQVGKAVIVAKQDGVLCGLDVIAPVFECLQSDIDVTSHFADGDRLTSGDNVVSLHGSLATILTGERVVLNYMGMLSGTATETSRFADEIAHTKAKVLDTRKTVPLHRMLQKYAVAIGGGANHRIGLFDMVLIKDNHIDACGGIVPAVTQVRERWDNQYRIEVETRTLEEVREAIGAKVDRIMLDNMTCDMMREAVGIIDGRAEVEASGNVALDTIGKIAETGVDFISIGRITHSTPWFDFSLLVDV